MTGVGVAVGLAACLALGAGEKEGSRWLDDYEQALRLAKESGRPLFVVLRCEH